MITHWTPPEKGDGVSACGVKYGEPADAYTRDDSAFDCIGCNAIFLKRKAKDAEARLTVVESKTSKLP